MNLFHKSINLSLSKSYVAHWGLHEAIRELIQNALDSETPIHCDFYGEDIVTMKIYNENVKLERNTLLLGMTTKTEETKSIGKFGEGYKLALLVLCRSGYNIKIYNEDVLWEPAFKFDKVFNSEVLYIKETSIPKKKRIKALIFEVNGLTKQDVEKIKDSCLLFKEYGETIETNFGSILLDKPNMLYVGGLFICKTDLTFGYNIKPEHIKLERDRQTINSFDLEWLTSNVWIDSKKIDKIAELIENNCPDIKYVRSINTSNTLDDACYKLFEKEYGTNFLIARNQEEYEELLRKGFSKVKIAKNEYFYNHVKSSSLYSGRCALPIDNRDPVQVLNDWLEQMNASDPPHIDQIAQDSMELLINEHAYKWHL